jgi:hypothetical protein
MGNAKPQGMAFPSGIADFEQSRHLGDSFFIVKVKSVYPNLPQAGLWWGAVEPLEGI